MEVVASFINNPIVLTIVQLAFGFLVKKWATLATWPNKLIPLFNAGLAVLVKLAAPAEAHADTIAIAAVLGLKWDWLKAVLVEAVGQTLLSTGIHSTGKNLLQQIGVVAITKR